MSRPQQVEDFLPLPASVMHIVVALADGEKHGYAILRDVTELSGGAVRMGSGTQPAVGRRGAASITRVDGPPGACPGGGRRPPWSGPI